MKKVLFINALILTGTSLLMKTVGISFRVYISNKIGPEGMGLYQLIFSIYLLAATFATSGIGTAVTRLVAEEQRKGHSTVTVIMRKAFAFTFIASMTAALGLFVFAETIGSLWLHDSRAVFALRLLAPSLPFMAISSCLRGYFYGVRKAFKPASAQILEQLIKMLLTIGLLDVLLPKNLQEACVVLVLGTTVGEILSCAYVILLYCLEGKKAAGRDTAARSKGLLGRMLNISLPVAASSYVRSSLKTIENLMIPAGLEKSGASGKESLAEFGMLKGMVMPILTFPSAFLSSFSILLVPELSEAKALNHKNRINYTISRVFQLTSLLSILITGIFMVYGEELGSAIYHSQEAGAMLRLLAPLVPLMYFDRIVDGMLKGLNQQVSSLKYDMIDSLARITMVYYLIPARGFEGFVIVIFISNILNSLLSMGRLLRVINVKLRTFRWFVLPAFSAAGAGLLAPKVFDLTCSSFEEGIGLGVQITLTCAIYFVLLLWFRCIGKEDLKWFKDIFISKRKA